MVTNLRKFRTDQSVRDLYAETTLGAADYIIPFFIVKGSNKKEEIRTLPDVYQFSTDLLLFEIEQLINQGINKILLFGVPEAGEKDETGSAAYKPDNIISHAIREIKTHFPEVLIITDVCLCAYTNHGHCGVLSKESVDNGATLPLLARMAVVHAEAGTDFIAPSAMMDFQVKAIRGALDLNHFNYTKILSYSAKYASSFYGPFRDAAKSAPSFGDRKTYQMDFRNSNQALAEIQTDIEEGADMVMVKPAHTYLDVISRAKARFSGVKIAAYHVSGEYAMVKYAARQGILNEVQAFKEVHTAIKRAGTDLIISYFRPDAEFFK